MKKKVEEMNISLKDKASDPPDFTLLLANVKFAYEEYKLQQQSAKEAKLVLKISPD